MATTIRGRCSHSLTLRGRFLMLPPHYGVAGWALPPLDGAGSRRGRGPHDWQKGSKLERAACAPGSDPTLGTRRTTARQPRADNPPRTQFGRLAGVASTHDHADHQPLRCEPDRQDRAQLPDPGGAPGRRMVGHGPTLCPETSAWRSLRRRRSHPKPTPRRLAVDQGDRRASTRKAEVRVVKMPAPGRRLYAGGRRRT